MDRITFSVNKRPCSVGHELDSDVSLNDYIRNILKLSGTKYMCKEGGCGSCIVAVKAPDHNGVANTFSVNSCLISITSCQDWEVTTIEGLGDRRIGYHPIARTLAEYDGTQCGYCSPGWVMSMYSLLEANCYNLTQHEIENSFGSNTCRCTGYRPILDAFKSFAKDAPKPKINDIEDLVKACKIKGKCYDSCESKDWCIINKNDVEPKSKKIHLKDNRVWYRVHEIAEIFHIFDTEGCDSYMLVNGNTGKGVAPIFSYPRVLIDIRPIKEIKGHYIDQNLIIGAGTTLNELMEIFLAVSGKYEEFKYLKQLYDHLDLVAHIPVRNVATIAGNLMMKHKVPTFSSDVFLLLETVGALVTVCSKQGNIDVSPEKMLKMDMHCKVITKIKVPPYSKHFHFVSFKIMSRSQNVHATVNAGFLYEFEPDYETIRSARIVFGGISGEFVHATRTEIYLYGTKIFTNEVLQRALKVLEDELVAKEIAGELKPEFRKKLASDLFYKGLLVLIPKNKLDPKYHSGARDFKKSRPLSKGTEVFDTNPLLWPLTEPLPKVEALIQTSGEAKYVNDIPPQPNEVFSAFVTSDVVGGEVISIDASPALKLPGVVAFFDVKDIPGKNVALSGKVPAELPEELLVDKTVKYYDQPIGIIVAETEKLANRAALLVQIKYKVKKEKPIIRITDAQNRASDRITLFLVFPARDRGTDVQRVFKGSSDIKWQYHFPMETLSCVTRPSDDGIQVFAASQWLNSVQVTLSEVLNISQSRIDVMVPRCGGAYGIKLTRATIICAASALTTYLLNRPSRFVMSIAANMRVIGKRGPCRSEYEIAVDNNGRIQYLEYHFYLDNGYIFSDLISAFLPGALRNCYDNQRWAYKIFNVLTETASNTYCRAPGSFEAIAMTEYIMERIAVELDKDPFEVRIANLNPLLPDVAEIIQSLIKDSNYNERKREVAKFNKENRWKKRGIRVAAMSWPVVSVIDYHVLMSVFHGDGSVVVKHGGVEIGQGINTKVIQVIAFTLNISMDKVKVKPPDTTSNPNNFATSDSRSTQSACIGAIKCCQIILDRLSALRDELNNPTWDVLVNIAFQRGINLQASYQVTSNDQPVYRSGGAAISEVELDILTGEHEILRVDILEDCGVSMNPELDVGQVEGSFVFGTGFWTCEDIMYDENTGELLTDRTWTYHVPLAKDIPIDFRVTLRRNSYNPIGALGAKAVSEPPTCLAISVAFALRAAITASREDTGFPRTLWFDVDGPYTIEANVLKSEVRLDELVYH